MKFSNTIETPKQIISKLPDGTAPLSILSKTMITNLNAEMIGGKKLSDLALNGSTAFSGLTDVTITSPASDHVIMYNGTKWVNTNTPNFRAALLSGYKTTNTSSTGANSWAKIGTLSVTSQYGSAYAKVSFMAGEDGSTSALTGVVYVRVKQQNAMGSVPIVELRLMENEYITLDEFKAVTVTNTASETKIELYMQIKKSYQVIWFIPIMQTGSGGYSITWHDTAALLAALPAGTQTACTYDMIDIGQLPDASTTAKGIVQLNNTISSTSTVEAATANAVKTAYDLANSKAPAGFGLGTVCATATGDWNNYKVTGFYMGSSLTNQCPASSHVWKYCLVTQHNAMWCTQIQWDFLGDAMYIRSMVDSGGTSTWGAWKRVDSRDSMSISSTAINTSGLLQLRNASARSIEFTDASGTPVVQSKIRSNTSGALVLSSGGGDKTIYLRPGGDTDVTAQVVINTGGTVLGGTTSINSGSKVIGTGADIANMSWLGFYENDGTTRVGWVGDGSSSNGDMMMAADAGNVKLYVGASYDAKVTKGGTDYNIWHAGNLAFGTGSTNMAAGNHTHSYNSLEIGRTDGVASTPFIDFHSGATATDFDARIIASAGNGTNAGGALNIQATTLQHNGYNIWSASNLAFGTGNANMARGDHNHDSVYHKKYMGSCTDFNTALTQGDYSVGNAASIPNAPYTGGIYGKLRVYLNDGGTHDNLANWIWQYFDDTSGRAYYRWKVNAGAWTAWYINYSASTTMTSGRTLQSDINDLKHTSMYKTVKDANGIYTTVEYKDAGAKTVMKSVLSGGTSPKYTTRTETWYKADGTTTAYTKTYTISYDTDGNVVSEVMS